MSFDSQANIAQVIEQAIHLGMPYLCITDHHDIDYEEGQFLLNAETYYKTLQQYQKDYKDPSLGFNTIFL